MDSLLPHVQDSCADNNLPQVTGYLFLTLINSLFGSKCTLGSKEYYPKDYAPALKDQEVFDFIVVGSGSAGSLLANKLSENGKYRVLVLEAGGYPSAISDIPSLLFSTIGTKEDWKYTPEKNPNYCRGYKNSKCTWPQGKVLGGSSSINAMLYIRGNERDYDRWAEEGNVGWDWKNVLKTYKKIENIKADSLRNLGLYGTEGLLPLTQYKYDENIRDSIQEAFEEVGIPKIPQENPYEPIGVFDAVQNIENGQRANAAKVFLGSAKDRNNLFVSTNTRVTKVVIDKDTLTARGVEVVVNNKNLMTLFASKEVIISGGAVNTPHLLMLSGLGPKDHLQSLGIDVIQDLPVGKDLQDHLLFLVVCKLDNTALVPKSEKDILDEIYKYFMHRDGSFAAIRLTNFVGFVNTRNESKYPNVQMHFILNEANEGYLLEVFSSSQGHSEETLERIKELNKDAPTLYFGPTLLNPKSRGEITLKSADPFEKPLINVGYMSDETGEDMDTMLQAIRLVQKIMETPSMKKHNPTIAKHILPNCAHLDFDTDNFWRCSLREFATTLFHPTSSARMGTDPKKSVVDSKLRVHGVKKLRVADASVMPYIISGNTNAPSMMIGYKAGEMILEDYIEKHSEL